jgi:hypothetical protein
VDAERAGDGDARVVEGSQGDEILLRQTRQLAQGGVGTSGHGVEHGGHETGDPLDGRAFEAATVVREFERQLRPVVGHDVHRKVGLVVKLELARAPGLTERLQPRVVFRVVEDDDGFEQRCAAGDLRRGEDVDERRVLVRPHRLLVGTQLLQELPQRFPGRHARAHRHGVDEQADARLRAGNRGAPARPRRSEDHVFFAGERRQDQRPCCVDEGRRPDALVVAQPMNAVRGVA